MNTKSKLTAKQREFCNQFVKLRSGKAAAIAAGYKPDRAREAASRNLKKVHIAAEVERLTKSAEKRTNITTDRVLKELAAIAFLDPVDYINDDGSFKSLSQIPAESRRALGSLDIKHVKEGKSEIVVTKIKVVDKIAALDRLGKHLGMFTDKVELSHAGAITLMNLDELPEN